MSDTTLIIDKISLHKIDKYKKYLLKYHLSFVQMILKDTYFKEKIKFCL